MAIFGRLLKVKKTRGKEVEDEVEKDEEEEAEIEKSQLMMIGIHEIYTRRNVPGKVIGPQKNLVLSDTRRSSSQILGGPAHSRIPQEHGSDMH